MRDTKMHYCISELSYYTLARPTHTDTHSHTHTHRVHPDTRALLEANPWHRASTAIWLHVAWPASWLGGVQPQHASRSSVSSASQPKHVFANQCTHDMWALEMRADEILQTWMRAWSGQTHTHGCGRTSLANTNAELHFNWIAPNKISVSAFL